MEKVQLNFTEYAAECVNTGNVYRRTTTELYDLYNHPEDIHLYIQIVGDESIGIPSIFIDDVTLKTLRFTLARLNRTALSDCIVWLRAYDGTPLQEFAVACNPRHEDFKIYDRSFRLCDFTGLSYRIDNLTDNTLVCHESEVEEAFNRIKNIIK